MCFTNIWNSRWNLDFHFRLRWKHAAAAILATYQQQHQLYPSHQLILPSAQIAMYRSNSLTYTHAYILNRHSATRYLSQYPHHNILQSFADVRALLLLCHSFSYLYVFVCVVAFVSACLFIVWVWVCALNSKLVMQSFMRQCDLFMDMYE